MYVLHFQTRRSIFLDTIKAHLHSYQQHQAIIELYIELPSSYKNFFSLKLFVRVFQETRKICIGIYTHIIYNEFLEVVIGRKRMNIYDLTPLPGSQFYHRYIEDMDPRITNEFASVAFRFGHALITPFIK